MDFDLELLGIPMEELVEVSEGRGCACVLGVK